MTAVSLQLSNSTSSLSWLCHCRSRHHHREPPRLLLNSELSSRRYFTATAALTKQVDRFISTLKRSEDANRLISKFVSSSNKSIALNALSYLLSPQISPSLSSLALPLYSRITQAPWFDWNPKLIADLIALLDFHQEHEQSKILLDEAVLKLRFKERDLILFYCNLIESQSKHKSELGFSDSYVRLNELVSSNSSSNHVKRQGFKSMVGGLCEMGRVREAESVMEDMKAKRLSLSLFEFRSVLYGYGKLGLFEDMLRVVNQMESQGFGVDLVSSNMVLSSYGARNALSEMVSWLCRMKTLQIPFSIRTYNSVLNSCPKIMSMVQELKSLPLSMEALIQTVNGDEALLVKELVESCVLSEAMDWGTLQVKLDLHSMHLGSAYLIMLQWMEEMRNTFRNENAASCAEITVVCGSGKHSSVRGESPVKAMVRWIMVQTGSPMRIDRKNIGCFVAKGKSVKDWLC